MWACFVAKICYNYLSMQKPTTTVQKFEATNDIQKLPSADEIALVVKDLSQEQLQQLHDIAQFKERKRGEDRAYWLGVKLMALREMTEKQKVGQGSRTDLHPTSSKIDEVHRMYRKLDVGIIKSAMKKGVVKQDDVFVMQKRYDAYKQSVSDLPTSDEEIEQRLKDDREAYERKEECNYILYTALYLLSNIDEEEAVIEARKEMTTERKKLAHALAHQVQCPKGSGGLSFK